MPRFFVNPEQIQDREIVLTGDDAHHVSRSLRMAAGEQITVCDGQGKEYQCELTEFLKESVVARILGSGKSRSEPPYFATVFQALPKGDKLDAIIQKAVECGACRVALFESERCIARRKDGDGDQRKNERRNRIALEAAKQCGRGMIPDVLPAVSFAEALEHASRADLPLFCYEGEGTERLPSVLKKFGESRNPGKTFTVSVTVGSEGGFSEKEAEAAKQAGMLLVGLGKRILRTETAASFVLGCLSYEFELNRDPEKS